MDGKEHLYSCHKCKHKHRVQKLGDKETCNAFPEGIPACFLFNVITHVEPFFGDKGILFERRTDIEQTGSIKQ